MSENNQPMESMADYEEMITHSFKRIRQGDVVTCTIIGIKEDGLSADIGSYMEGFIPSLEVSYDPSFSIFSDIHVGDTFQAYVMKEDNGEGLLVLSLKRAKELLCWDAFKQQMEEKQVVSVTIQSAVNGGVIAFLEGIRAFIPASQLSIQYVENLDEWINKSVDAIIITVDAEKKRLVLSAKEVERKKADELHKEKISQVQKGIVTTGTVEKIAQYGAFVSIGEGLSGLVHISRICGKHIKSPNEVVKVGDTVKVKVIDVVDGKISLDMRAVEEQDQLVEDASRTPIEHIEEEAGTSLAALLGKFNL